MTSTNACLVLGDADYEEPVREPPVLIPEEEPELVELVDPAGQFTERILFSALLRSRDAGQGLQATLLTDYGVLSPGGQPWADNQSSIPIPASPPGTEQTRTLSLEWRVLDPATTCHSVTMVVSHQFAEQDPLFWCPVEPTDVARLTWWVATCTVREECSFEDCKRPEDGFTYCPLDVVAALSEDDG